MNLIIPIILALFVGCNKKDNPDLNNQIIESNNVFAFKFFKQVSVNESQDNYMVSPISLSMALNMTYNGAEGETKDAFDKTLEYKGISLNEINETNKSIMSNLIKNSNDNIFEIANSIWYRNTFQVKKPFVDINKTYYDAEVKALDFSSPQSVNIVNNWVSKKTHDKIPEIIENISAETMMYLINAIYFNGTWKYEFDPKSNEMRKFYNEKDGSGKNVMMMSLEAELKYLKNDLFSSVILPYKDYQYEMIFFKPLGNNITADIIKALDSKQWSQWKNDYSTYKEVKVIIPKFKFEYKNELRDELSDIGLGVAFTNNADFKGISKTSLKISNVLQKTYIDVSEKGTEAAAVTSVTLKLTSFEPGAQKKIVFNLDRSFIFMIIEKQSGVICFIGKVGMPSSF